MANVLLGIHCVVPGCGNTQRRVNQWKVQPCNKPKHKGKSHAQCLCPEPYQFFKFPHEVKLQKLWLERVKRPDLEVNNLTRVCSLHFVEGKPTRRNYFPNIINVKKNVRVDDDEADNEEEVEEEQYYEDESMQDEIESPPPKRRGVSIVPMEMLQEQEAEEDDGMGHEDQGDEEYERNVTVSRYKLPGNVGEAYEVPTNSVTITRVSTTVATTATPANKPSNRFISKTRVVEGSSGSGNRFLWDRRAANSSSSSIGGSAIRRNPQTSSTSSRPLTSPTKKTILMRSRLEGRTTATSKQENVHEQAQECPYEIDMLMDENDDDDNDDDDGGDSSELSDIGIDIQTTTAPARKKHFTSKDLATAKTLSSLVVSRHMTTAPSVPQKEGMQVNKPRVIPVLAVAPKTQLQQGTILQPIQTIGRTNLVVQQQQQNRKSAGQHASNLASTSTSCKPIITSTTSLATSSTGSSSSLPATKSVIAVTGSIPAKPEMTSIASSTASSATTTNSSTSVGQQQTPAGTPTLATYDPSRQQLQIANPVKYIQECHARIAQLLAEKQALESQNSNLEAKVQELLKSNNDLRREIVHQALNAARRAPPQQLTTPTFNLVPTAVLDNNSTDPINNGNGTNTSSDNGNNVNNKTRIRYVIRRPTNLPSANIKK